MLILALFKVSSGSCRHRIIKGIAPAANIELANSTSCLAMADKAWQDASLTDGSYSSKNVTKLSKAPESITLLANVKLCLAMDLSTNAAAFF